MAVDTTVSPEQSTVSFSSTTGIADGIDTITVTVILRNKGGGVITSVTPALSGLRDDSDVASPFELNPSAQSWTSQITSTQAGSITLTVSAQNLTLATQELTFTEPSPTPVLPEEVPPRPSFIRILLTGLGILILLLLVLFFLWRRLRKRDDEDQGESGGVFPGSGEEPPPASSPPSSPPSPPVQAASDVATFNPTETLQRGNPPPPPPSDSIPLQ